MTRQRDLLPNVLIYVKFKSNLDYADRMVKLPIKLSASHSGIQPWQYLAATGVLQLSLTAGFYFIKVQWGSSREHTDDEDILFFCAAAFVSFMLGVLLTWQQHKRFSAEDRVRQRLLDVIDAVPDPAVVLDTRGQYVLWNKAAEAYHGIAAKHVLGKTPMELFPPHVAREILALHDEVIAKGEVIVKRTDLPALYGKGKRIATVRCGPIYSLDSSHSIRGIVTILHDVTAEEEEAMALRYTAAQLKMALNASGFGSWVWDLDSNVVTYSEQYQRLLRYKGTKFNQDFHFNSHVHPEDLPEMRAAAVVSLKENKPFNHIYRLHCFDSEYRTFHASGEPTIDQHGRRVFSGLLAPLDRSADL